MFKMSVKEVYVIYDCFYLIALLIYFYGILLILKSQCLRHKTLIEISFI